MAPSRKELSTTWKFSVGHAASTGGRGEAGGKGREGRGSPQLLKVSGETGKETSVGHTLTLLVIRELIKIQVAGTCPDFLHENP